MSTKVANVIAIELGILIAVLAWLAIARVPSVQLLPRAQDGVSTGDSFATVAPVLRSKPQNFYAPNDVADRASSVAAAEQTQAVPEYVQELSYASSDYAEDLVAETSPYYVPVVSAPDCYVAPVAQFVEFVQPRQFIVFSNPRSCGRSNRSPACFSGGRAMVGCQRPSGGRVLARNGGVAPRQNASSPPVRQKPGSVGSMGPRGSNRTPGHAGNGRARRGPISGLQ